MKKLLGNTTRKEISVVFVNKDQDLLDALALYARRVAKEVDTYRDPQMLLNSIRQYSKQTRIILGRTFDDPAIQGIQIAEQLHDMGFTRIYLLSSEYLSKHQIPNYLTVIKMPELHGLDDIFED
jgi:hypothetical protein